MRAKDATETISFRIPASLAARLSEAGHVGGFSAGEYARRLVIESLSDTRHAETTRALGDIRQTIDKLREDMATVATALLAKDGPVPTQKAKEWVRRTLLA